MSKAAFYVRLITYFGQPMAVACDGKCHKAWGISQRPCVEFDPDDPDDNAMLADDELGEAPADPGTYEGGEGKPLPGGELMSKWCIRECERCERVGPGDAHPATDFSRRVYNQPWKHPEAPDAS